MRKLVVLAALGVSACASSGIMGWSRIDGRSVDDQQLAVDQTVCRGEMEKAGLAGSNREGRLVIGPAGIGRERDIEKATVFEGCMAQRGYVAIRTGN